MRAGIFSPALAACATPAHAMLASPSPRFTRGPVSRTTSGRPSAEGRAPGTSGEDLTVAYPEPR